MSATNSVGAVAMELTLNKSKFNKGISDAGKSADSVMNAAMGKIKGYVATAFSVTAIGSFMKTSIDAATKIQSAWTGLKSIADGSGRSFGKAQQFISEYTKDGLLSINEAATAYKNLLSRGYDTTQIEKTMNALKDSAAFGRQSSYSLGEAVVSATEGLKNENSILVDNAGVTKNVAKMWEEYAKAHGITTAQMTQAQKIEAEYNGILKETAFQTGDAATYTKTFGGQCQMLKATFTNLTVAVGQVVAPIAQSFIPIINSALVAVTNFVNGIKSVMATFGIEFPEVVGKSTSSIGNIGASASNASDDIASTGKAAKKAAKEINKAFSNVDEIHVLSTNKNSSAGSGSGSSSPSGTATASFQSDPVTSEFTKTNGAIDAVMDKFKELKDLFTKGFNLGFDGTSFDGIIKSISNIKASLKNIFTSPEVMNASNEFVNNVAFNFGKITGSIGKIGTNIAEGLVKSIETFLSQNSERIKTHIANMFTIGSDRLTIFSDIAAAYGTISEVFSGPPFTDIGSNIISAIVNPLMSAYEVINKFANDIIKNAFRPLTEHADELKGVYETLGGSIETVSSTIATAFTYIGDTWNDVYNNSIGPLLDDIGTGLSDTFGKFIDVYNEHIAPVIDKLSTKFSELWDQHMKPVVDKVGGLISALSDYIGALWNNYLKPVVDWVIQNVVPVLMPIIEQIWNTTMTVFGYLFDAIGGIIDALSGLINFIVGVFTGDWEKAWDGIKQFFGGIWDAISGIISAVWENIKGAIETTINVIKAIIEGVFNGIKDFFSNIWNGIKDFIFGIWNGILDKVNSIFPGMRDIIETILKTIKNTVSNILNTVKNTFVNIFNGIKNTVSSVINGIKSIISTGLNTVKTTFTNIFNGIWGVIKNVCNFILGGIEGMVNGVIKGVNKMVGALNNIHVDIPDWIPAVGGKSFGINLPTLNEIKLPRLANGAYFERNNPQLAVVGDNTREGEITTPESKIYDQVSKALKDNKESSIKELAITIYHKYEDGRTIIQKVNQAQIDAGEILLLT